MFSKCIKSNVSLKEQKSKLNSNSFGFTSTDFEGLEDWLYNREERFVTPFNKSNVTLDNVNTLTGRDGWDDNFVHSEGNF